MHRSSNSISVDISAIIGSHESVQALAKKRQLQEWLGHVRRATALQTQNIKKSKSRGKKSLAISREVWEKKKKSAFRQGN